MNETKAKRLVIVITHNGNDDKASVGFTIANSALSIGLEVGVFLTSDGVELGRQASSELTVVRPLKPLRELIEGFLEKGGLVWSCAPCFQHRGLRAEENHEKVIVTGAGPMLEWIADGAATLSF